LDSELEIMKRMVAHRKVEITDGCAGMLKRSVRSPERVEEKVSVLKDSLKVYINFTYLRWLNLEWSETK